MKVRIKFQKIPNAIFDLKDYSGDSETTWEDLSETEKQEILDGVCEQLFVLVDSIEPLDD